MDTLTMLLEALQNPSFKDQFAGIIEEDCSKCPANSDCPLPMAVAYRAGASTTKTSHIDRAVMKEPVCPKCLTKSNVNFMVDPKYNAIIGFRVVCPDCHKEVKLVFKDETADKYYGIATKGSIHWYEEGQDGQ